MILSNLELRTKIKMILVLVFLTVATYLVPLPRSLVKKCSAVHAGIRYFTDFGPLRLDIGFPVKPRKKVDKAFQLYFGIGQGYSKLKSFLASWIQKFVS